MALDVFICTPSLGSLDLIFAVPFKIATALYMINDDLFGGRPFVRQKSALFIDAKLKGHAHAGC